MTLSLVRMISQRQKELAVTRGELVRRMGYANIAKGCRRIDQVCHGHVEMAEKLRGALARGLEVDVRVVDEAIEGTRAEVIAAEDRAYRESFKPHAVILTERRAPSQITMYAVTGGAHHRIIPMNEGSSPKTFATQARKALPKVVPFFGRPTGFVINYTPDFALKFDRSGRLVARLDRAYRVGESGVIIGGKYIGESTWAALLGEIAFRV